MTPKSASSTTTLTARTMSVAFFGLVPLSATSWSGSGVDTATRYGITEGQGPFPGL